MSRPVLILGPLAEPLINKLTSESPDKYCSPKPGKINVFLGVKGCALKWAHKSHLISCTAWVVINMARSLGYCCLCLNIYYLLTAPNFLALYVIPLSLPDCVKATISTLEKGQTDGKIVDFRARSDGQFECITLQSVKDIIDMVRLEICSVLQWS